MGDPGNGYAPTTLEQLAHAFDAERDANRGRFGEFEGKWGKHVTELAQLQRSQRSLIDGLRDLLCRFDSYLLDEKTRRTEEAVLELKRHEQLQQQIRAAFAVARKRKKT